jgi:hypothetical protein
MKGGPRRDRDRVRVRAEVARHRQASMKGGPRDAVQVDLDDVALVASMKGGPGGTATPVMAGSIDAMTLR